MDKYKIAEFLPYGREPILRRMKDGSLVCLFLTGGPREPDNDNVVKIVRSEDDGKTWSEPKVLFSHKNRACWSTELFTDCDKPFSIVQTYYAPSTYVEIQTYLSYPSDDGKDWTNPISLPTAIKSCSVRQGLKLSNGDILFPVYWQEERNGYDWSTAKSEENAGKALFTSGVIISSDGCENFYGYGRFALSDSNLWEPNVVEIDNGHLIIYMRHSGDNSGYLYLSESFDYGRTWQKPVQSSIPNADTKVSVVKIKSKVFMINNFTTSKARTNLAVAVSDDGKDFKQIINVEDSLEKWFYPHAYVDYEKETLYLAYENSKQHYLKKYSFKEIGL